MAIQIVAVIPARGGSKGIPRKNLKAIAGKPLLAYTIKNAQQISLISRIIVSTDDNEIAKCAKEYGAEIVLRPAEISGDTASSELALMHVIQHLKQIEDYSPDILVFLQCTSPLTLPEDIEGTIQVLINEGADSALAVSPFFHFLWRKDDLGSAVGINHNKNSRMMRQEFKDQYIETGAIYVMKCQGFLSAGHRFFGKTALYIMPNERCLEIDAPNDLVKAENLLLQRTESSYHIKLPKPVSAVVLDFDGVFTNNQVLVFQDGSEAVFCHRGDGWGLVHLIEKGIKILVLSSEANTIVQARCKKLGLNCIQDQSDKLPALINWSKSNNIDLSRAIYVGNDLNDKECMMAVGYSVAVADAHPSIRDISNHVLRTPGGFGAIREIIELIIQDMEV